MTRVSVETSFADLDTRDEPNMEAAAQSIPPVNLSELTFPFSSLVDSDFRDPLFQVPYALLFIIWKQYCDHFLLIKCLVLQMYKAMQDIATLSSQKKEEMDNQAFDWGMRYKRLEKHCARQKEIYEHIREANVSILKEAELKQLMAAEANARAKATDNQVTEVQTQHSELQNKNAELQRSSPIYRIK